jgi:hypothetical protein
MHPRVYIPFARWKYRRLPHRVVTAGTELVIDGFQRSGNTFAQIAFELAQPRPVRVVHHLHAPAQIITAVEMAIPTILLIREPEEAILSHVIFEGGISVDQALRHWVRFYERLLPYRSGVVVGEFREVTSDFGSVIRAVNNRFGTAFAEFAHEENEEEVFRRIEERNRARWGVLEERMVPRPSAARAPAKERLLADLHVPRLRPWRERAYGVYGLVSTAGTPG